MRVLLDENLNWRLIGNMYHLRDRIPLKIYWWKGHGKPKLLQELK